MIIKSAANSSPQHGESQPGRTDAPQAGRLERDLTQAGEALLELGRLRWQRLRLTAREGAHGALLALWLGLVGAVVTGAAALFLVAGLAGALAELAGDRPWFGRLTVGALGVAAGWMLLGSLRTRMRRLFAASLDEPTPPTTEEPRHAA